MEVLPPPQPSDRICITKKSKDFFNSYHFLYEQNVPPWLSFRWGIFFSINPVDYWWTITTKRRCMSLTVFEMYGKKFYLTVILTILWREQYSQRVGLLSHWTFPWYESCLLSSSSSKFISRSMLIGSTVPLSYLFF